MGKFFASADKKLYKVEERVYYCGKKGDLDTVVFVHGLGGNHQKTWKKFPALLKSDPDLPNIDVLLWGYKTGAISAFVQGTKTLGRHLVTTLTAQVVTTQRAASGRPQHGWINYFAGSRTGNGRRARAKAPHTVGNIH